MTHLPVKKVEGERRLEALQRTKHRTAHTLDATKAERIVNACYDDVLAYCRRHAPAGFDASDLAQETFLRFVRNKHYLDQGKPLAYLLSIARNLCIDAARAGKGPGSTRETALTLDDERIADTHDDIADVELALTLARLSEDTREVIELRFDQGLGVNEVASVLGISRFAARRRIASALKELKRELVSEEEAHA